jgi:hypothetical protein
VAHWRPPYDRVALMELIDGMEAAIKEADRLMRLVPAQFRPHVEIRPEGGSGPGWDIRVVGREPYDGEDA